MQKLEAPITETDLWIHRAYYAGLKDAKDIITKDPDAIKEIEEHMKSVLQSAKDKENANKKD